MHSTKNWCRYVCPVPLDPMDNGIQSDSWPWTASSSGWWFQPIWKICSSKWVHLPQVGMKIKHVWHHHKNAHSKNLWLYIYQFHWILWMMVFVNIFMTMNCACSSLRLGLQVQYQKSHKHPLQSDFQTDRRRLGRHARKAQGRCRCETPILWVGELHKAGKG